MSSDKLQRQSYAPAKRQWFPPQYQTLAPHSLLVGTQEDFKDINIDFRKWADQSGYGYSVANPPDEYPCVALLTITSTAASKGMPVCTMHTRKINEYCDELKRVLSVLEPHVTVPVVVQKTSPDETAFIVEGHRDP